jgi:hypothetical protein
MPVYTPIQASVTAKSEPFQAGSYPYSLGDGEATSSDAGRQTRFLVIAGVLVLGSLGLLACLSMRSGKSGMRGVGSLHLTRSIPAK